MNSTVTRSGFQPDRVARFAVEARRSRKMSSIRSKVEAARRDGWSTSERVGRRDPLAQRRMAVEEPLHQLGGLLLGEVLLAQPTHGRDKGAGIPGQLEGEAIGAPFVRP